VGDSTVPVTSDVDEGISLETLPKNGNKLTDDAPVVDKDERKDGILVLLLTSGFTPIGPLLEELAFSGL
jgi:hypothetical protein